MATNMIIDKLSDEWLFQDHSKETIKRWLSELKCFYFIRAWGGHANDGDCFKTQLIYKDQKDLTEKLKKLLKKSSYDKKSQPGHQKLWGQKVFVWISKESIELSVFNSKGDDPYGVSEEDFKVCKKIEERMHKLGLHSQLDRRIEKSPCCISQSKYPELY